LLQLDLATLHEAIAAAVPRRECLLGAHRARVAPFNVDHRYVEDELAYLLRDARPRAVIYHARFAASLGRILDRLDGEVLLLQVADESGADLLPGALDYEAALGTRRPPTERLRHVAHIGVRTRDFAFRTHGRTPPPADFRVTLSGPGPGGKPLISSR
jgi:hypothetical protein